MQAELDIARWVLPNALVIAVWLYAAGIVLGGLLQKFGKTAKFVSLGSAFLASFALFCAGLLSSSGVAVNPLNLISMSSLGSFAFGVAGLSGFFAIIIGFVGMAVSLYSYSYISEYSQKGYNTARFCVLFNLFLLSMAMVVCAQNAAAFLVFWEFMALSSFFLVTYEHKEQSAQDSGSRTARLSRKPRPGQ